MSKLLSMPNDFNCKQGPPLNSLQQYVMEEGMKDMPSIWQVDIVPYALEPSLVRIRIASLGKPNITKQLEWSTLHCISEDPLV